MVFGEASTTFQKLTPAGVACAAALTLAGCGKSNLPLGAVSHPDDRTVSTEGHSPGVISEGIGGTIVRRMGDATASVDSSGNVTALQLSVETFGQTTIGLVTSDQGQEPTLADTTFTLDRTDLPAIINFRRDVFGPDGVKSLLVRVSNGSALDPLQSASVKFERPEPEQIVSSAPVSTGK